MATNGTPPKAGVNFVRALCDFNYDGAGGEVGAVTNGQVFPLGGHPNDHLLLGMGYVADVPKGTELVKCGECGAMFVNDHWRTVHGDIWHSYTCDGCGWTPKPGVLDKRSAIQQHRHRCPTLAPRKMEAHKRHVAQAKAKAEAATAVD